MRILQYCLVTVFLILLHNTAFSQLNTCGADAYQAERIEQNPKYAAWLKANIKQEKINNNSRLLLSCNEENSLIIPVAVHYNTPVTCEDLTCLYEQAQAQIAKINEDFAANNADLSLYTEVLNGLCSTAYPSHRAPEVGEGTCIQFCLANQNHPPCSNLEDGQPAITVGEYTWLTKSAPWDGYVNMYVSSGITAGLPSGILGIAPLPGFANGDGVFVRHDVWGAAGVSCTSGATFNTFTTFDNGRAAVHELGHYFGLPHVFSGGSPDLGCVDGDNNPPGPIAINDTPTQDNPSVGCPIPNITNCDNTPEDCPGYPHSFYSFMDYADDACMVMFTEDQSSVINHWANTLKFKTNATYCNSELEEIVAAVCPEAPSCTDGIRNQGEENIDCGGPCNPCLVQCGNLFFDDGGECQYYSDQMSYTVTLCPDVDTELLSVNFIMFDVEEKTTGGCWDYLKAYAGSDTSAPQIGGEFCGNNLLDAPGQGSLTAASPGDCFTFEFFSDDFVVEKGWDAEIICEQAITLPVELSNFTLEVEAKSFQLNWTTQKEINNAGFDILRRAEDEQVFRAVGFIEGNGSTSEAIKYSFIDRTVFGGITYYYKLRQRDYDGNYTDSKTLIGMIPSTEDTQQFNIYPNPIDKDFLNIQFSQKPSEALKVQIFDMEGRVVLDKKQNSELKNIDVSNLIQGVYLFKVLEGDKVIGVERLMRM